MNQSITRYQDLGDELISGAYIKILIYRFDFNFILPKKLLHKSFHFLLF